MSLEYYNIGKVERGFMSFATKKVKVGNFTIANDLPITLFAGPCQIESLQHSLDMAGKIAEICKKQGINFIYKSSFDKANRSSIEGKRGVGLNESLKIFTEIKKLYNCPIVTDVHVAEQCDEIASVVDILQIPAFLCRQTDLLIAAAKTGKIIKIKKGQFLAPWDMANVVAKVAKSGNDNIMVTERGSCFGYNRLINDMRGLTIMQKLGYPVVFDATHSVQEPGGLGSSTGGQRELIRTLARAAVAVGVAALYIETHQDPDNAPSDGPCMLPIQWLNSLLEELKEFDSIAKKYFILNDENYS